MCVYKHRASRAYGDFQILDPKAGNFAVACDIDRTCASFEVIFQRSASETDRWAILQCFVH